MKFMTLAILTVSFHASSARSADFALPDPRTDKTIRFADFKEKKAIALVFLGTQCPVNNAFVPELARLHQDFGPRGVQFLGINANAQDTPAALAAHAKKFEITFPVLKDAGNVVADQLGAERTPEVFVLNPAGKLLYRGRIDDQYGIGYYRPGKPTRRDLAEALEEVLAGKPVSVAKTDVAGCKIGRVVKTKNDGTITFAKHIVPILQNNCQECHRPGQIGPMALKEYRDVVAWADTIKEVVAERRMPPWFADPKHGKFKNDRSLKEQDIKTLVSWIDGGMPRGDDKDLPPPRTFPEGWVIGTPDTIVEMPKEYEVPAEAPKGGVPYQYFSVNTDFKEDRWVVRAEAKPGATSVVHHILVFIVPPGQRFNPDNPGSTLVGQAPGEMPMMLGDGTAKKIPAGSRLVFQMHYTPDGKARTDRSKIGLIFAKEPPQHRILTKPVHNAGFITRLIRIPAGADNFKIEAEYTFPKDGHVTAFMPHMHLRGKSFRVESLDANGKATILLEVPRYNFNWQAIYRLEKPLPIAKGTKLRYIAHFDNSDKNPHNPDASKDLYWGDQTWQEMMVGWTDFYFNEKAE